MSAAKIFSICFLYMVIYVETETISNQTRKLFDNEYLASNRPDSPPQVLELERGPEEYAAASNDARREGRRAADLEATTYTDEPDTVSLGTSSDLPTKPTRLIPYSSSLPQQSETTDNSSRRTFNPNIFMDPKMEQLLKNDKESPWSFLTDLNNRKPKTEDFLQTYNPNMFTDLGFDVLPWSDKFKFDFYTTKSPGFTDLFKDLDEDQDLHPPSVCENAKVLQKILSRLLMLLLRSMKNGSTDLDSINNALDIIQLHLQSDDLQSTDLSPKLQRLEYMLRTPSDSKSEDIKTKLIFKKTPPKLKDMNCNTAFLKLMAVAYDSYMKISKYPDCNQPNNLDFYPGNFMYPNYQRSRPNIPTPNDLLTYLPTTPKYLLPTSYHFPHLDDEVISPRDILRSQHNLSVRSTNTVSAETSTVPILRTREIGELSNPKELKSFGNNQAENRKFKSLLHYLNQNNKMPDIHTEKPKVFGDETSTKFMNDLANDIVTPKYNPGRSNDILLSLQNYRPGQKIVIPKINDFDHASRNENQFISKFQDATNLNEMLKQQNTIRNIPVRNYFDPLPATRPTLLGEINIPKTFSYDQVTKVLNRADRTQKPETYVPPSLSQLLMTLQQSSYPDSVKSNVMRLISAVQPELKLSPQPMVHSPAPSQGRTLYPWQYPSLRQGPPSDSLSPYFSVNDRKNSMKDILPDFIKSKLPNLEDIELNPDLDLSPIDEKKEGHIVNIYLSSECKDFSDKQKRFLVRLLQYFNILHPDGGVSKNNAELLTLIIRYLKEVLEKIDRSSELPDTPEINKKFLTYVYNLINSTLENPEDVQNALDKVEEYIDDLRKFGQDLTERETLDEILLFVQNIVKEILENKSTQIPQITLEEIFKLPGGIDEKFLIQIHKMIISLVPSSQQNTILLALENFINHLIEQGVDMNKTESFKLILIFLKNLFSKVLPTKPLNDIDSEFVKKLHDHIMSVVSEKHRQFVLNKVEEYIKSLLRQGTDLSKPENLNLIIKYVNDVISTLNTLPTTSEKPPVSKEFLVKITQIIKILVKDLDKIENVKTRVLIYIQNLLDLGIDLNTQQSLELIFKFIKETITDLENKPTQQPDTTPISTLNVFPPEFVQKIIDLLASSLDETQIEGALAKLEDYTKKLILLGKDLSRKENLQLIVAFVNELIKTSKVHSEHNNKGVDKDFLIKLYQFISSSVPSLEEREMIKMKAKNYMMNLLRHGIDLTNHENLNLVIKYVNELIANLPPMTDATPVLIDQDFLNKLIIKINSLVKTTRERDFIKAQLLKYIKKLIEQGIDLNKKENLKLLVIFVQKLLNQTTESTPLSTEPPEVNKKILEYAYELIYKLIINPAQRQSAIRYLHQYIKWAVKNNFDLNDRENLNQLIILIISLIKNNESLIMPSTLTDPGGPPLTPKEVEITYTISTKMQLGTENPGVVKYRVPYHTFVGNLRDILLRKPLLRSHQKKLEDELITASKITEVSPELQKIPKDQLIRLISRDGSFVDAKIPDDENKLLTNNALNAEEFERMIQGLDEMINKKIASVPNILRTTKVVEPENAENIMKHYLLIHHDGLSAFDPIAYLASDPMRRLEPAYYETSTVTNPSNTESVFRRSNSESTAENLTGSPNQDDVNESTTITEVTSR